MDRDCLPAGRQGRDLHETKNRLSLTGLLKSLLNIKKTNIKNLSYPAKMTFGKSYGRILCSSPARAGFPLCSSKLLPAPPWRGTPKNTPSSPIVRLNSCLPPSRQGRRQVDRNKPPHTSLRFIFLFFAGLYLAEH